MGLRPGANINLVRQAFIETWLIQIKILNKEKYGTIFSLKNREGLRC